MDTPLPLARKLSLCLRRFFVFHNIRIYSLWFYLPLERHNWACNLMTSDEKPIRYPFPYSVSATLESALKSPERSLPSSNSLFIHFPSFFRFFIASLLFCNHITHCFDPLQSFILLTSLRIIESFLSRFSCFKALQIWDSFTLNLYNQTFLDIHVYIYFLEHVALQVLGTILCAQLVSHAIQQSYTDRLSISMDVDGCSHFLLCNWSYGIVVARFIQTKQTFISRKYSDAGHIRSVYNQYCD
jgi:hypothetical protein